MKRNLAALGLAALLGAASAPATAASPATTLPADSNVLFWSQDVRDLAFQSMERVPGASFNVIAAGGTPSALPQGAKLDLGLDLDDYMASQRHAGLLILVDGKIRTERYALGFGPDKRWTSFSVAKSFTSTLVGAAIKDGAIGSLDDQVTRYIPQLASSGYDGVTVEQLLTMTSGVRWNENYADPDSDVARFNRQTPVAGEDLTVSYMKTLPREAEPGTRWRYNTGETNLIGVLVSNATGKTLSAYLSEKVWQPYGMEQDAIWLLGATDHEISGCCISASLRDYARFGQFLMDGGRINGQSILPEGWMQRATAKHADIGIAGRGYGYQWWTYDNGSYAAQGIFGQGIFIDPTRKLVIVSNGNWPKATDAETLGEPRQAFYRAVQAAVDRDRSR
ncbi:serine hydrolase domain-containing protein [Isoalcanivorax beigongshangi]|uniref:Serine hydrolase domain-containing protein n=1 Tax=Isoalcanivorax beigongshangi TaxID=3238810 RepID=A0ABV4AJB6_9GAMM